MPHTGLAQSGPVSSTIVQNATPTSAVETAQASARPWLVLFPRRKNRNQIATTLKTSESRTVHEYPGHARHATARSAAATLPTFPEIFASSGDSRTRYTTLAAKL